jgi:hypothetical protein
VRCIGAPIFDVLDESAQFGQDLTFPWIVQENPWCGDGKGRQESLQSAFSDRRFGERTRHLRKSHTLDRCPEECGVVVRDERPSLMIELAVPLDQFFRNFAEWSQRNWIRSAR